jgi:N-acyl-D-aspartate/D-glutamate deacylase
MLIEDAHIAEVFDISLAPHEVLDAEGAVVAPGFIDMHSHAMNAFLINGKLAVDASELTGALAGEVLTPRTSARPTSH